MIVRNNFLSQVQSTYHAYKQVQQPWLFLMCSYLKAGAVPRPFAPLALPPPPLLLPPPLPLLLPPAGSSPSSVTDARAPAEQKGIG